MINQATVCESTGEHERLKSSRDAWDAGTVNTQWQSDFTGGHFEMADCAKCRSTLVWPPSVRRRAA